MRRTKSSGSGSVTCPRPRKAGFSARQFILPALLALSLMAGCAGMPPLQPIGLATPTLPPTPAALEGAIGGGGDAGMDMPQAAPTATAYNKLYIAPTATLKVVETESGATATPLPPILYYTQSADTLLAVASRFGAPFETIRSPQIIEPLGLLPANQLLLIPAVGGAVEPMPQVLPDSEVVYSPSAIDFDIQNFASEAGGYLKDFREWHADGWQSGASTVMRVASENSINPRLLLAILEFRSHWVYGAPTNLAETDYPFGFLSNDSGRNSLYGQLTWTVTQLNQGYYGWRAGTQTYITFKDGEVMRLDPTLNAGSAAVMSLFAKMYTREEWSAALYGADGFGTRYEAMFGSPWNRAMTVEPLFPPGLTQPDIQFPFAPGKTWSFTGGPHAAWIKDGPLAALDFAPSGVRHDCYVSDEWATAAGAGLVVRSEPGVVVLDLDGDGHEQTGWTLLYLHLASEGRPAVGTWLNQDDPIGHPSCEGGVSTGTHVHLARKYNGEWILADGPLPFTLSGWYAHYDGVLYHGTLTRDGTTVASSLVGSFESLVSRPKE